MTHSLSQLYFIIHIHQEVGFKVSFCPKKVIDLDKHELIEVYEGKANELKVEETKYPLGGYGQSISHVIIMLKSTKWLKSFKQDTSIHSELTKEGITVGNIMFNKANSNAIKCVGRSNAFSTKLQKNAFPFTNVMFTKRKR
ncbi:hypothetical protein ACHAW6_013056 [Cyclotella cf. meneghiniana]